MNKKGNQSRENQMNPHNRAYYQSRRVMSGKPRQNENQSQNRSNQMNLNNLAYYQCQGNSTRPNNWASTCQRRKTTGFLEHKANIAGTVSSDERVAIANDIKRIEKVVKEQLDGGVMIYKGSSRKKGVNIGKFDLDVKIKVSRPMSVDDHNKLGQGLGKEYGKNNVDNSNPKIHKVKGKAVSIDIVPRQAEYLPPNFRLNKLGVRLFATNNRGQHAVRILKECCPSIPGVVI